MLQKANSYQLKESFCVYSLSPIMKVVSGGCNLRCSYCFYSGHQPEIKLMAKDTAYTIVERIINASPKFVTFIWHGGEPTLAGIEFYQYIIDIQNRLILPGQVIRNTIQTNGTLIDEEWADFFRNNDWGVGVSIDGPEHLYNLNRIDTGGQGTFNRIQKAINILKEKGLKVGAIAVINRLNLGYPKEIFDFIYGQKLSFYANPCSAKPTDSDVVKNLSISPTEYSEFLLKLFDLWLEKDDPRFRIKPLEDIVKSIFGGRPPLCKFRGECQRYITIDYNGDVYPCDEFLEEKYLLGNLVDQDTRILFTSKRFTDYYSGRKAVESLCKDCKWYNTCKGGCMREWNGKKSLEKPNEEEFCLARKILFEGIKNKLS